MKDGSGLRKYDLEDRLVDFAVKIIKFVEALPKTQTGNYLGNPLVRSGTSTALNYGEAQSAESRKDFIHKMKVSLKELRETNICLKIMERTSLVNPKEKINNLITGCNELISIFVTSIATAKRNQKK